jgi:hypothetical protein
MSSSSRTTHREGPDPPPTRPTLVISYSELGSLGEEIIGGIMDIADEGKQRSHSLIVGMLPGLFDKVMSFVSNVLAMRGPNDGVAYWAEQTYRTVQRIEKKVASLQGQSPTLSTATTAAATVGRSWATVAAHPPLPLQEETALRQVKVCIDNLREQTALWTTANNTVLGKIVAKEQEAGIVGIQKLPSGDLVVQLKDREGRQVLAGRRQ